MARRQHVPAPPPIFEPQGATAPQSTPNGGTISILSPGEAHDVGSTVITVNGQNFRSPQDLRCNFGSSSVVADYVSSTQIKCTSPNIKLPATETGKHMPFWLSGGGEISNEKEFLIHATLLVSDAGNDAVHAFDAHHGHYTKTLIKSGVGGLSSPQGISFGNDGNIYVASAGSNQILKYNPNGQSLGVFSELPKSCYPSDIIFGPDSNLFVACEHMGKVVALNANSGQQLGVAAQGGGLKAPKGLAFGPGNTLFVVSAGSNAILKYAQGGYFQGVVQRTADPGTDVAFFGGRIFYPGGASVSNSILMIDGQQPQHFAESFMIHDPQGLCFDQAGYMFVSSGPSVLRFTHKGHYLGSARPDDTKKPMVATYLTTSPREVQRKGRHDEL